MVINALIEINCSGTLLANMAIEKSGHMDKSNRLIQSQISNLISTGNFDKLIEVIDAIIDLNDDKLMIAANKALANAENLSSLIIGICKDSDKLNKTIAGSYYHENGFHKIVLLSGKQFKLRLHHFGVSAKIPMENIHDHRWNFTSTIINGNLKMDLFRPTEKTTDAEKVYHFIYESEKSNGNYSTEYVSEAHLIKSESRIYRPGDTYLMKTHELHRIRNSSGEESMTLILTGKPISSKCNLFSRRPILEEEKMTVAYEREKMIEMLENVCEKICPNKMYNHVYSY